MSSSGYVILLIFINVVLWVFLSMMPRIKKRDKIFLVLSFVTLWVFLSIRAPYSDAVGYANYFQSIDTNHFNAIFASRWEFLFKFLLFSIKLISSDTRVMMTIVAFITLIGPFLFIKRYSKNYLLSIITFIAIGSFYTEIFILRQAIAISIFLAFFYLLAEKKIIKYCLAVIVAALFHKTAIVLLLLYPLVNIPPSKYKNISIILVTVVAIIVAPWISNFLVSDLYEYARDRIVYGVGINLLLFYVAMYAIYLLISRKKHIKEKEEINGAAFSTVLIQSLTIRSNIFSRMTPYLRDSFCILIPNLTQEFNRKNKVIFTIIVIIICICYVLLTNDLSGYIIG